MRHYSTIEIGTPEPGDPPVLVIRVTCDRCPPVEWRTHIVHLGTLVRALTDTWVRRGGDDGTLVKAGEATTPEERTALRKKVEEIGRALKARRQSSGRN
jgi:hypothetical protein